MPVGATVSTVKERCAGVGSSLPASSRARTEKVCGPSPTAGATLVSDEYGDHAPWSSRVEYCKLPVWVTSSVPVNEKLEVFSLVGPLGPDTTWVSGGVVSGAGVGSGGGSGGLPGTATPQSSSAHGAPTRPVLAARPSLAVTTIEPASVSAQA